MYREYSFFVGIENDYPKAIDLFELQCDDYRQLFDIADRKIKQGIMPEQDDEILRFIHRRAISRKRLPILIK